MSQHWQQQLLKCEMVRAARSPHHRARASAMAARTVTKSAIPITNPNATPVDSSPPNHPSSTAAPEAPRPTASRPESSWNSLDMGGVNIKTIPPTSGLFSFTFLVSLYLNHNSLTTVPPQIANLRHLEHLDLSGNALASLPTELGMLTRLKELFLFDNHITTIPPEFGSLHQLQTLGIEGNPLDVSLKSMIQTSGTQALISYLRDTCPAPPDPPPRDWKDLVDPESLRSEELITALSYNILCEKAATERLYGYTPSWALAWDYRKDLIVKELRLRAVDFLCLQEVDIAQYEDFFCATLAENGYEGVYWPKSRYKTMNESERRLVDGCATFYNAAKYQLVEKHLIEFSAVAMQRQDFKKTDDMFNRVLGKDHIAVICLMENKHTGTRFIIANTHIHWDPAYKDVKLVQVALLIDELEKITNEFAKYPPPPSEKPVVYSDGSKVPLIICSDLNSVPDSSVYEFLSSGSLPPNHPDFMSHVYGKYTSDGLGHRLGLKDVYAGQDAGLTVTNYTPGFQGVLDYIWYTTATLSPTRVLEGVSKTYLEKVVGFPNSHYPSECAILLCQVSS